MPTKRYLSVTAVAVSTGLAASLSLAGVASAHPAPEYVQSTKAGVSIITLAAAGDKFGAFTLPGVPDGLGAYRNPDGTLTVLQNHELSLTSPAKDIKRAWGGTGSVVSRLTVDTSSGTVTKADELIRNINFWNYQTDSYGPTATAPTGAKSLDQYGAAQHTINWNRFCSGNLVPAGGLATTVREKVNGRFVTKTLGFDGPVWFTGEEGGDESRALAVNMSGEAFQLPRLGLAAWENFLTAPSTGKATVIMGNEDGSATDSQLWMYYGTKTDQGTWADRAGLTNGKPYVLQILDDTGLTIPSDVAFRKLGKGKQQPISFARIGWDQSGVGQNGAAARLGTTLARVEDGEWDPNNKNVYWFLTTESAGAVVTPDPATGFKRDGGALWKVTFKDAANPFAGGVIEMVLDGSESIFMNKPDNLAVTPSGVILIQEDPGGNDHLSRIVAYNTTTKALTSIVQFNPSLFAVGAPGRMTNDEESSGIIDVTKLVAQPGDTAAYFLFNAQVHTKPSITRPDLVKGMTPEQIVAFDNLVVEGGALYLMKIDNIRGL